MGAVDLSTIINTPLPRIATDGGDVLHALKESDKSHQGFGEAYFSWVLPNAIKAWKRHNKMTMNLIVPVGKVQFVFFDGENQFLANTIGTDSYSRLTVPPGVWFGFQGIHHEPSLVLNISNILHDPQEADRMPIEKIQYTWK